MIWFTADTHFGHANIIAACGRPWETADEMSDALIANINASVGVEDVLYILGDFSYKMTRADAAALRTRIACRHVRLVNGNHDKNWAEYPAGPDGRRPFEEVRDYVELKLEGGRKVALFHYPMVEWASAYHDALHLHGHIHSRGVEYNERNREQGLYRYDVGVDANGYAPVSIGKIVSFFEGVPNSFTGTGRSFHHLEKRAGVESGD